MGQEFETQILDIDKKKIADKLRELGAKEEPEVLQKRWVYDMDKYSAESQGKWIRLRQVGNKKPMITYKNKTGKGLGETKELEVEVSDFDKTAMILDQIDGFTGKYYQENKRHKFVLDDIEFTLDTWPMIPTFLEIEAKSEKRVHEALKMLGLSGKDDGHIGTVAIYHQHGIDLHSYKTIKFEDGTV